VFCSAIRSDNNMSVRDGSVSFRCSSHGSVDHNEELFNRDVRTNE
jgi:hypothetical protein